MAREVLVLGGGSAGFVAAMTLKRFWPDTNVTVVRSPEIGVIGVGESTTPNVPDFLFRHLGLDKRKFYELVQPTWKLGIRFLWGPRPYFNYGFDITLDVKNPELPRPNGYYCDDEFGAESMLSALMYAGKACERQSHGGGPVLTSAHAFHLENAQFVEALEVFARERDIKIIDGKMEHAERGPNGVSAIVLEDGRRFEADFFVDASGFRSELLGRLYETPFHSYRAALFNDRAILGSWTREDEPINPYTTAETMDAGWSWRIEHEQIINRGYVYSSDAISEEAAREEFSRKNPKAKLADRVVKFQTGRYDCAWIDNVLALGNACGFVEPLEATSLMLICWQLEVFIGMTRGMTPSPSVVQQYNLLWRQTWDEVKDFLALHFWANTRLDTPYWRHCRADTDVSGIQEMLNFYEENGPTSYLRYFINNPNRQFGLEGFLVMFVGNKVPTRGHYKAPQAEADFMWRLRAQNRQTAAAAMDVREALAYIRHPQWKWHGEA